MASRPLVRLPLAALAVLALLLPAWGQSGIPRAHRAGTPYGRATQRRAARSQRRAPPFAPARLRRRGERRLANGLFFYPDLFPDYYEPVETEQPVPQQVVVEQPAEPAERAAKPIEPVVLEERDGQWVRVPTGSQVPVGARSKQAGAAQGYPASAKPSPKPLQPPANLPPAVLVFRDGHREQVRNYMIEGNTLYTSADYWTTGSWTRKIPLSALNVSASLKVNAERGARFSLPKGPDQVVVRF